LMSSPKSLMLRSSFSRPLQLKIPAPFCHILFYATLPPPFFGQLLHPFFWPPPENLSSTIHHLRAASPKPFLFKPLHQPKLPQPPYPGLFLNPSSTPFLQLPCMNLCLIRICPWRKAARPISTRCWNWACFTHSPQVSWTSFPPILALSLYWRPGFVANNNRISECPSLPASQSP